VYFHKFKEVVETLYYWKRDFTCVVGMSSNLTAVLPCPQWGHLWGQMLVHLEAGHPCEHSNWPVVSHADTSVKTSGSDCS